jgi:hypothetical protein
VLQVRAEVAKLEKFLPSFREYTTLLRDTLQVCHIHQVRAGMLLVLRYISIYKGEGNPSLPHNIKSDGDLLSRV